MSDEQFENMIATTLLTKKGRSFDMSSTIVVAA